MRSSRAPKPRRSHHAYLLVVGVLLAAFAPSCACGAQDGDAPTPWEHCQGSNRDFVQKAMLAINGRRPWGEAESQVYTNALDQLSETMGEVEARKQVARVMMQDGLFRVRWIEFMMDALLVPRTLFSRDDAYDQVQSSACFGRPIDVAGVDSKLAEYVRDNRATATTPPVQFFRLGALLSSSIALDDITPFYRAYIFHMMSFALPGANVPPLELEAARRLDFGLKFHSSYLNRDVTCMQCHNSKKSVTAAFPLPGQLEQAIYGDPEAADDPLVYYSVFRVTDVVEPGTVSPWGWDGVQCGLLGFPSALDPLDVDAQFASIKSTPDQPYKGKLASVWLLEGALADGFSALKEGLDADTEATLADPSAALSYLVAAAYVERVWTEIIGSPLTVAHHLPRTAAQGDMLRNLTQRFVSSGYSLKELLLDIVTSPHFNLAVPNDACWADSPPYPLEMLLNPWSSDDPDPDKRGNSTADALYFSSTRVLRSSLHAAMEWPTPEPFPTSADDEAWQASVGLFLNGDTPGFRGLDFQARLAWEETYGVCAPLAESDFIQQLAERAASTAGARTEDVVTALKDRMIGEPLISSDAERAAIESLIGASLDSTDLGDVETQLRRLCGAYAASPQFMLAGLGTGAAAYPVPMLTEPERGSAATCKDLRARFSALGSDIDC